MRVTTAKQTPPRPNRRQRRAEARMAATRNAPPEQAGLRPPHEPMVVALLPGAMMLRRENPPGVPRVDTLRANQVGALKGAAALASIPEREREAALESLSKTLRRVEYHHRRLQEMLTALESRRVGLPGEVFWDPLLEVVHFELQAFCGGARMALDELVYLIARRHGIPEGRARRWETNKLFTEPVDAGGDQDRPEVAQLRARAAWFGTLNAYRNSFFHHGWRHGAGHFSPEEAHTAVRSPAANGLLLPDETSLKGRSKPHEWTWTTGRTVPAVAHDVYTGLDGLLEDLCHGQWATELPAPGTFPEDRYPNLLVTLVKPAVLVTFHSVIVPFFTSEEAARRFEPFCREGGLELVWVRASEFVAGRRAISFSLHGIVQAGLPPGLRVYLDPQPADSDWTAVIAKSSAGIDLQTVVQAPQHPVSLPIDDLSGAFVWRKCAPREW
jgi:hypothetical protein